MGAVGRLSMSITYYQIPELKDLASVKDKAAIAQTNLLDTLSNPNSAFTNICFSLRYYFEPNVADRDRIKIYLIVNSPNHDIATQQALSIIRNNLSEFYPLVDRSDRSFQDIPSLTWANVLCELVKREGFSESQKCYTAIPFTGNANNTAIDFCKALNQINERVMLEISLQPYAQTKQLCGLLEAISEKYTRHYKSLAKYDRDRAIELKRTIDSYGQHIDLFNQSERIPFQYAIKLYTETQINIPYLIGKLTQISLKDNEYHTIVIDSSNPRFQPSLRASECIAIADQLEHNDWQKSYLNEQIKFSQSTNNNSLRDFYIPNTEPLTTSQVKALAQSQINNLLSPSNANLDYPESTDLVLGTSHGTGALTAYYKSLNQSSRKTPQSIKLTDLKPLHRLAFSPEITGFFRLVIAKEDDAIGIPFENPKYPKLTAEDLFNSHKHLITRDTYIVGQDDRGNIITSDWGTIPHRLFAGVTRSGKTNFLHWLLFQFLYANPKRKIYIADFKGVDFQFLSDLNINLNIAHTLEECLAQVAAIQEYEFLERQKLMLEHKVAKLEDLQNEGIDIDRTIWIIDEAADIADASGKVRGEVENSLKKYARQGASYGIQVAYCTQRVSAAVITPQVTDQCEERVIFRLKNDASEIVLGNSTASEIPMDAKGRAVLDSPEGRVFVNTPFIQPPSGSKIPISDTLWKYLKY
jgi:hypothetical protein